MNGGSNKQDGLRSYSDGNGGIKSLIPFLILIAPLLVWVIFSAPRAPRARYCEARKMSCKSPSTLNGDRYSFGKLHMHSPLDGWRRPSMLTKLLSLPYSSNSVQISPPFPLLLFYLSSEPITRKMDCRSGTIFASFPGVIAS